MLQHGIGAGLCIFSAMTTNISSFSTTGLQRNTTTTSLNANHCDTFEQNALCSDRYETLPIQTGNARMAGYAGFVPGGVDCYG